jgi:hypothetical protein
MRDQLLVAPTRKNEIAVGIPSAAKSGVLMDVDDRFERLRPRGGPKGQPGNSSSRTGNKIAP